MEKDILGRNIVDGNMAWLLKELGYKGWVSGYYHENEYESVEGEDALEYYDYECIGNRSGFVNENSLYRAAAPTLIEAYQFLVEHGYEIDIMIDSDSKSLVQLEYYPKKGFIYRKETSTIDEALDRCFKYICKHYEIPSGEKDNTQS